MKLLVVINTSAGFGENAIYDFMRLAFADGDEACVRYTDGATDPALLVSDADDFDAVVVSGGDGTIASVSYELAGTGIPVLPFPAGTANLLASNDYGGRRIRCRDHARCPSLKETPWSRCVFPGSDYESQASKI